MQFSLDILIQFNLPVFVCQDFCGADFCDLMFKIHRTFNRLIRVTRHTNQFNWLRMINTSHQTENAHILNNHQSLLQIGRLFFLSLNRMNTISNDLETATTALDFIASACVQAALDICFFFACYLTCPTEFLIELLLQNRY